jgi:hypothetical protein
VTGWGGANRPLSAQSLLPLAVGFLSHFAIQRIGQLWTCPAPSENRTRFMLTLLYISITVLGLLYSCSFYQHTKQEWVVQRPGGFMTKGLEGN